MQQLVYQTHKTLDRDLLGIDESTIKMIQEPFIQKLDVDSQRPLSEIVREYAELSKITENYGVMKSLNIGLKYSYFIPVKDQTMYKFAPNYQQVENGVFYFDPSETFWYQKVHSLKGKGSLHVFDHFGVFSTGKTLAYLRLVDNLNTNIKTSLGIIAVTNLQYVLERDLNDLHLSSNSLIYLTNASNQVITGSSGLDIGETAPISSDLFDQSQGNEVIEHNGKSYLMVYNYSDSFDTRLIILTPVSEIMSDVAHFRKIIFFMSGIYLLIIIFSVGVIIQTLISPLKKLGNAVQAYDPEKNAGNVNLKVDRRDEIGLLNLKFVKMTDRLNDLIKNQYILEIKQKESELTMLQQQINPHLLYNTLESIYWRGIALGQNDVAEMIKDLSKLMRIGLSQGRKVIKLFEEIEHAKAYLRLQQNKCKQPFRVSWAIQESCYQALIPKIVLQPLLENAIIHGISNMEDEGEIRIGIHEVEKGALEITVEDNGYRSVNIERLNALVQKKLVLNESIGILNVQQRIQLYFGESYGLEYRAGKHGGVIAIIRIPSICNQNELKGECHG